MDLAQELQKIYDSEINIRIGWLWTAESRAAWAMKGTGS
jgi:hypothetical protein